MASSKETYCLCGQPYNIGQFMIECDCCREWFHGSCVDVKIYQSDDIDKYHCPKCAQTYGPSVLKIPTNNHRADRYELGAETRPAQTGSPAWVRALSARPARPNPEATQRMRGSQFTEEFVRNNGFTRPVMFHSPDGLEMKVPNSATFTARSVLRFCGAQLEVEVIDVRKQSTLRMPLGEFIDYFETPPERRDEKVLNVISLEFSDTNMAPLVDPPLIARTLDWAERAWPLAEERPPRPAVQKYCLLSPAGSYTDWHVDFGGTSVWYHVLHGRKVFYLAPPTATNLALYQQWSASNNQNERFFGDMVEWYGTVELSPGETLVIPSGWLHAVRTATDSLVLGGNWLHAYAIETQLQMYEIERRVETPMMFRYPLFETMNWYAGAHLLTLLRRYNEESQDEDFIISESDIQTPQAELPPLLLRGIKILANALKEWHALKSTDSSKRDNVPKCLNSGQLVRELCKELRTLEKRTSSSKDKDYKIKNHTSPNKSSTKKVTQKKSIKLTLPKPIMHMAHNGEYIEEKLYDKPYFDNKDIYQDGRYVSQDVKYVDNTLQEAKAYVVEGKEFVLADKNYYPNYEEQFPVYGQDANGYVETHEKKNGESVLRIKLNNSPSSSREAPPPYTLPEHSILKSHLIGRPLQSERETLPPALKPLQQWTISKKDIGDYQEEQILFTNENLQANVQGEEMTYGPGMYSAEDVQQDYQYSEAAKPGFHPDYSYGALPPNTRVHQYHVATELTQLQLEQGQSASYSNLQVQEPMNGFHHEPLPSYDAAIAHQYQTTNTTDYLIQEQKKPQPTSPAVRRSERPARRRVSPTYDYEDGDLYIDEAPPPARRKTNRQRHSQPASSYRSTAARPVPANGIESLIQASVLAEEEPPTATEDAAVAGMLSISERYTAPQRTFGLAADNVQQGVDTKRDSGGSSSGSKRQRKVAVITPDEDLEEDEEDIIKEVHRDAEYVYPSLEMSSDEDEDWAMSRRRNSRCRTDKSKSDKDASWSPRGRLPRLLPRLRSDRAAPRHHVRAALTHARADNQNAKRAVLASKSRRPAPPPPPPVTPNKNNSRLKKGMKTAKQRLGKILKIHKMIY